VVNAAFMKLRKRKQSQTVSMDDLSPAIKQYCMDRDTLSGSYSQNIAISHEMQAVIQNAVNRLPDQYRAVFVLRDVDGLSNQETGEILNLSIPAVKSRLHRSRIMLRKKLQRYYEDFTGNKAVIDTRFDEEMQTAASVHSQKGFNATAPHLPASPSRFLLEDSSSPPHPSSGRSTQGTPICS
jgi:hypothetical protein